MSRFDFHSPGAAIVDTMTKVLAERKAEERQKMLDNLTLAADDRAAKAEERANMLAESQITWNKHLLEKGKGDMRRDRVKDYLSVLDPNIDPTTQLPPEAINVLKEEGWLRDEPEMPEVGAESGAEAPEAPDTMIPGAPPMGEAPVGEMPGAPPAQAPGKIRTRFIGTPEYREKEREKAEINDAIINMLESDDPEQVKQGQELATLFELTGGKLTDQLINRAVPGKRPIQVFNPIDGSFRQGPNVTDNTQVVTMQREPRQQRSWFNTGKVDKASGRNIYASTDGDEKLGTFATGSDTSEHPSGMPVGIVQGIEDRAGALMSSPEDPDALNSYRLAAKQAINNSAKQGNQKVKQWVGMFIDNPQAATQALTTGKMSLTTEEVADANMLLSTIGAYDLKAILEQNVPKPAPAPKGQGIRSWFFD